MRPGGNTPERPVRAMLLNVLSEAESRLVFDADDKPADNVM